jgi:hypothetical protein
MYYYEIPNLLEIGQLSKLYTDKYKKPLDFSNWYIEVTYDYKMVLKYNGFCKSFNNQSHLRFTIVDESQNLGFRTGYIFDNFKIGETVFKINFTNHTLETSDLSELDYIATIVKTDDFNILHKSF